MSPDKIWTCIFYGVIYLVRLSQGLSSVRNYFRDVTPGHSLTLKTKFNWTHLIEPLFSEKNVALITHVHHLKRT